MPNVSLRDPPDFINAALVKIGWPNQIGSLYDGSKAANAALAVYGIVRDDLMRDGNYYFAQRNANLTLLKSAPVGGYVPPVAWDPTVNPPPRWLYEYQYPDDALKIRSVTTITPLVPNFDPSPYPFALDNDNYFTPARKVILCNVQFANATYTGRVTDPATWDASFASALVDALGEPLAASLTGLDGAKVEAVEAQNSKIVAQMEQG